MEKNVSFKQQKNKKESILQLFQIETSGSSFNDGLVFTVIAEDNVWAEGLVREWLQCYGKETDKVDKIRAVVSRDVRAIINVGTKLLTT
jgi:phenylacetate-coenzyme A ligase PaaK-like adenylate-forming protein